MGRLATLVVGAALFTLVSACGSSNESQPSHVSEQCTPSPELIAQKNACQTNVDCPCGSFCDLGQCVVECTADADCADAKVCDSFGRCRDEGQTDQIDPPAQTASGRIGFERHQAILTDDAAAEVVLTVGETAVSRARVDAHSGAKVLCPNAQEFTYECMLTDLAANARVTLKVFRTDTSRRGEAIEPDALAELAVYAPGQTDTVSLPRPDQLSDSPETPAPLTALPGRYQGMMKLTGTGSDRDLDQLAAPAMEMSMQASASVWAGDDDELIIAIDDPLHSLSSREVFIGTLSLTDLSLTDDGASFVDGTGIFPVHPFIETSVAGRPTVLLSETVDTKVRVTGSGPNLSLQLTQSYRGAGAQTSPTVRWLIMLQRDGDTSGDAVPVPADATLPAEQLERLGEPTPWELAFQSTTPPPNTDQVLGWVQGTGEAPLSMCDGTTGDVGTQVAAALLTPDGLVAGQPRSTPRPLDEAFDAALDIQFSQWAPGASYHMSASLAPTVDGGKLPCRFEDVQVWLREYNGSGGWTQTLHSISGTFDACDQMRQATGCRVFPASDAVDSGMHDGYLDDNGTVLQTAAGLQMQVTSVCTLPKVTEQCAERIACLAPQAPPGPYQASLFREDQRDAAGDLRCAAGERAATFDFDQNSSAMDADDQWTMIDAVATCLTELDSLAEAPPTNAAGTGWPGYGQLYGAKTCVDVGRMLTALAVQTESQRSNSPKLSDARQARASAYVQRLVSRWLSLHGFLANESAQIEEMIGAIATETDDGTGLGLDQQEVLEKSIHGWDVLLAQHVLFEVINTPEAVLAEPDYRAHRFGSVFSSDDEASEPLASVILASLARQSEFIDRRLAQPSTASVPERLQVMGEFIPRSLVAQALAADLYVRATQADDDLDWTSVYSMSWARLATKSSATFEQAEAIVAGDNPLGIADSALPLYFRSAQATDAGSRFSVVSDFIAGDGPGSTAWAPAMVAKAQASLADARQAYIDKAQRNVQESRAQRADTQWMEKMRGDYNAKLREYCGPTDEDLVSSEVFDAARCPVITTSPECTYDLALWLDSWTDDDLDGRFCMASELEKALLAGRGFADPDVHQFASACLSSDGQSASASVSFQACEADASRTCLRCDADPTVDEVELDASTLRLSVPRGALTDDTVAPPWWKTAKATCQGRYPQMNLNVAPPRSPFETPGCVGGSLGEAYLDIVSATQDLEQSRAQFAEYVQSYDIAMKSCLTLETSNASISQKSSAHGKIMHNLRAGKAAADSAAAAASGVKDCLSALASGPATTPWDAIKSGVAVAGTCVAAGVESAATIASIGLQAGMDDAQANFESEIAGIESTRDVEICQNDARQQLVGATAAGIAVEKAAFDLARAKAEVDAQLDDANRLWTDGHAYLQKMQRMPASAAIGDPWYSERIRTYTRDFKLARRATYLAVRAVEYEFQETSSLRQAAYEAKVPADLETILQQLWTASGTRSIGGSRPTELGVVVSLRDDIWRLGDRSDWPEELRALSPGERFQMLLNSERYAQYDERGDYLGQRIPFSLVPLGALGIETNGVSIFSQTDCAERLWSLNASLIGEDLYRGSDTSFVRMDVLKRNTFFSQWCGEAPEGQPFQLASVTPTRNLFREPGVGEDVGSDWGVEHGPESFARARIQAFFGVGRADLEDPQYANGETSELAARGLYGDYALFIPAALISRDDGNGLVLGNIDDVLLRIDYLSVAAQ